MLILRALEITAIVTGILAAWLWYRASTNQIRRICKDEEFDLRDMNRMITQLNRGQELNRRAAVATAVAALAATIKYSAELAQSLGYLPK
jgi:hypothetical protein